MLGRQEPQRSGTLGSHSKARLGPEATLGLPLPKQCVPHPCLITHPCEDLHGAAEAVGTLNGEPVSSLLPGGAAGEPSINDKGRPCTSWRRPEQGRTGLLSQRPDRQTAPKTPSPRMFLEVGTVALQPLGQLPRTAPLPALPSHPHTLSPTCWQSCHCWKLFLCVARRGGYTQEGDRGRQPP